MRVFLISLLATISSALTTTAASALEMRGLWLDNKAWDGVQAVVQMYDCEDGNGLCARIIQAYQGELAAGGRWGWGKRLELEKKIGEENSKKKKKTYFPQLPPSTPPPPTRVPTKLSAPL